MPSIYILRRFLKTGKEFGSNILLQVGDFLSQGSNILLQGSNILLQGSTAV
jgi:hypothetical protein